LRPRCSATGSLHSRANGSALAITPRTSRRPLSLREVVHLLDTVGGDIETGGDGMVLCWAAQPLARGDAPEDAIDFVRVSSEVHPELDVYYRQRLEAWAEARAAERTEHASGKGGEAVTG
jgi:hypothetical protein